MGRTLMYATILILAVFVLSSYAVLQHGGESLGQIKTLSVRDLNAQAPVYNGAKVIVNGVLQYNNDLKIFEMTAPDQTYPVPVSGMPDSELSPYNGKTVTVTGKFVWESHRTAHIELETIHELYTPTPIVPSVRPG